VPTVERRLCWNVPVQQLARTVPVERSVHQREQCRVPHSSAINPRRCTALRWCTAHSGPRSAAGLATQRIHAGIVRTLLFLEHTLSGESGIGGIVCCAVVGKC
jgi:hypothetical protein